MKVRNRAAYTFANINLLGPCNVNCFFCLGKDIETLLSKHDQTHTPFEKWPHFLTFLEICKEKRIKNLYITGQNTDALCYKYLDTLVDVLISHGFDVGIRTNGYLAHRHLDTIQRCKRSVNYSIHSLTPSINARIMGREDLPAWHHIIPQTPTARVAIVVNEHNEHEVFDILDYVRQFDHIKYVQLRKISTDKRYDKMAPHMEAFERVATAIGSKYRKVDEFHTAPIYDINGQRVSLWRTVSTTVNSMNYFTDGTISGNYFVVEGYLKNYGV